MVARVKTALIPARLAPPIRLLGALLMQLTATVAGALGARRLVEFDTGTSLEEGGRRAGKRKGSGFFVQIS